MNQSKLVRHRFYCTLLSALKVVWPIFSLLLAMVTGLGLIVSYQEDWAPLEGIYFAFVTALTVGYGDLAPKHHLSRILAIAIGFNGVLLTALFAALSVRALQEALGKTAAGQAGPDDPP